MIVSWIVSTWQKPLVGFKMCDWQCELLFNGITRQFIRRDLNCELGVDLCLGCVKRYDVGCGNESHTYPTKARWRLCAKMRDNPGDDHQPYT